MAGLLVVLMVQCVRARARACLSQSLACSMALSSWAWCAFICITSWKKDACMSQRCFFARGAVLRRGVRRLLLAFVFIIAEVIG